MIGTVFVLLDEATKNLLKAIYNYGEAVKTA